MQTTLNGTCNTASGWVGGAVGAPNAPLCVWNSGRGREGDEYLIFSGPDADARVAAANSTQGLGHHKRDAWTQGSSTTIDRYDRYITVT